MVEGHCPGGRGGRGGGRRPPRGGSGGAAPPVRNDNVPSNRPSSSSSSSRPKSGRGPANRRRPGYDKAKQEADRLELERKQREEEEAAAKKAAAEAEAKRLEEIERRNKIQSQYDAGIKNCIATLESYVNGLKLRGDLRRQLDTAILEGSTSSPLMAERLKFEQTKKSLKSDLKKCTAFVKKVKSGSYPTPTELNSPNNPIKTLNLTRYVEEVAAAIAEPNQKIKPTDVPSMVMLCVEMHRRYEGFAPALIPSLMSSVTGQGSGGEEENTLPKRLCLRILTEFLLHGIITDLKPILKVVSEAAGAPSEGDKEYVITDANVVITFAKTGGLEVLGVVSRTVRAEYDRLRNEIAGKGEGKVIGVGTAMDTDEPSRDQSDANQDKMESTAIPCSAADFETPFVPTLTDGFMKEAQAVIESYDTITSQSRAAPQSTTRTLHSHCMGAYRTISNSYVATHRRLIKLEKRCEQDRLLQGNLSEAREKGLSDARTLLENLKKSVETLSDVLDVDPPVLPSSEEEGEDNAGATDGRGIKLWTKNENDPSDEDRDARLGPFDDEETRSFYCDVPDLLATKPPALLGVSLVDLEKQKERNARQYGSLAGGDGPAVVAMEMEDVETKDDALDEFEEGDTEDATMDDKVEGVAEDAGNKDTPHYKLMVLLEQELPEASRREKIDELADRFCVNHGSNKNSRKRLYKTLFLVPHARLDLLPYWSRFAAILDRVYSDSTLVADLEHQLHGQARFKKNQNLDSRLRTARYLSELTKFRVAPPIVVLRGIKRCLEDFTGYNIDVACSLLENCGRYLYRTKHTHKKLSELMDTMMRIKKARNLDERHVAMINSAFFMVNPPRKTMQPAKKVSPLEAYLRHLMTSRLDADDKSVLFVSKQIQRLPWSDPSVDCGALVCKYMMKACRKGRYKATKAVALLAANLKRNKPEIAARLIDNVVEEIQWFLEHPHFRDHQRTLVCARIFGELYCSAVIPSSTVFEMMHHVLNFGHEIPDALREVTESQETFAPRGKVTQTIHEDEELEDGEEKNAQEGKTTVVPVSRFSSHDPRVFCHGDPPTVAFRIKLVTTILDTVSSLIVTVSNKTKIEFILASLQRYLFVKSSLPSDVEFSVLDLFDSLDSQLKKLYPETKRKPQLKQGAAKAPVSSFVRYNSWIDAHKFVIAAEMVEFVSQMRTSTRLLAQAGLLGAEDASTGHLLEDDSVCSGSVEMTDEDDEYLDRGNSDSDVEVEEYTASAEDAVVLEESDNEVSEEKSVDDEEPFDEESEIDEVAAEAAYLRQLQDEAFESELRKLTMDALEKGKNSARTGAGGKVSSQMPAAPHFIPKKPGISQKEPETESLQNPFVGEAGISFKLLKKGNKGKMEEKEFIVPSSTTLARRATKQDDEAAKERDLLKARVLQYEAESAELRNSGGNVYLDDSKLQVIRNRPLTMDAIDSNFGKSKDPPYKLSERSRGRGRGGGRLFNPGRG